MMTERSPFLLRAAEALRQARQMKPGPGRNDLRQLAKVLRALANLDTASSEQEHPSARR